jgi:hypothetical protein
MSVNQKPPWPSKTRSFGPLSGFSPQRSKALNLARGKIDDVDLAPRLLPPT